MASSDGHGGGGNTKSMLSSGSGMAGVPALTAGKCCVLAASGVVGGGVPCGSPKSEPWSPGVADAAVFAAGERCVLAALGWWVVVVMMAR